MIKETYKESKKVPYQGSKKSTIKELYKESKKKYLIKGPCQISKKSTLSKNLIKNLKKVPY